MLQLAGNDDALQEAGQILAIETALAQAQWTRVENRDPVKVYNRLELRDLAALMPGYDWQAYLDGADVTGRVDYLIVSQPSYLTAFNLLLQQQSLPAWKAYFRWRLLSEFAAYLSRRFVDESFAFYGTTLRGIEQQRPRWKRGIALVDGALGEALGRLYVARHFPPDYKQRMDRLVQNLLTAYQQRDRRARVDGRGNPRPGTAEAGTLHHQDRLPGALARLWCVPRIAGGPARQRHALERVRLRAQPGQARTADRPGRVAHERRRRSTPTTTRK